MLIGQVGVVFICQDFMNIFVNTQECWDKDTFSDDFMGSVQFTQSDLHIFTVCISTL